MAILIDPKGLLWGKRLRKLSNKARLYYPLMLGISNFYARIELDEPCILSNFTTFKDADLTEENLALWINEYTKTGLAFPYKKATQTWMQFDTPVAMRRSYPTAEDNTSPSPPEPAYTDWLKSIHGAEWEQFHLTNYQKERQLEISAKRAAAGRKGAAATNAKRWGTDNDGQQNQQTGFAESANQQSRLVVVEGVVPVVGEDVVEGEGGTTIFNLKSDENHPTSISSEFLSGTERTKTTATTKTEAPVKRSANGEVLPALEGEEANPADLDLDESAKNFANAWYHLMGHNPKFDRTKLPSNYIDLWTADFRAMLDIYPAQTVNDLLIYSQTQKQKEYNFLTKTLRNGAERNLKFMQAMRKVPSLWAPHYKAMYAIIYPDWTAPAAEEQIEFLDEEPKFNIEEEDDYDELDDDIA